MENFKKLYPDDVEFVAKAFGLRCHVSKVREWYRDAGACFLPLSCHSGGLEFIRTLMGKL